MKITIESTSRIITLRTPTGNVEARLWEGTTTSGIAVHCLISRIAVSKSDDNAQFEAELIEQRAPSAESSQAFPLRMIL